MRPADPQNALADSPGAMQAISSKTPKNGLEPCTCAPLGNPRKQLRCGARQINGALQRVASGFNEARSG